MAEDKKGQGKKSKSTTIIIVVLTLVIVGCAAFLIWHELLNKQAEQKQDNLASRAIPTVVMPSQSNSEEIQNPIDFKALQAENTDIYAWINIENTKMSFPILQNMAAKNKFDEFYLDHLPDKTSGFAGSIFTQGINNTDFHDANTVIYGHELKNQTMFSKLHDYESQEFMDSHKTIYIYTPEHVLVYEVMAAVEFSSKHVMGTYDYSTEAGTKKFIDDILASPGIFNKECVATGSDKLITLSTCIAAKPDKRYLVVAKLIKEQ